MSNKNANKRLPKDMDKECVKLCEAMNLFPGIQTIESCCGHGESPYRIWFKADALRVLPPLLYWFNVCHCGFRNWRVIAVTDCRMSPVEFCVEGPVGQSAYEEASDIAKLLKRAAKSPQQPVNPENP